MVSFDRVPCAGRVSDWVGMLHGVSKHFGSSGVAAGVAACAALPLSGSPARGQTLESALMQAYQNNPSLNSQRAATRAIDEGVPQALSGYRPKVTVTGVGGEQTSSTTAKPVSAGVGTYSTLARLQLAGADRRHHHADALQRLPDRQQNAPGRKRGAGRARDAARHRADRAAERGDRLYESAARQRHPRSAAAQRRSAAGAAAADARPLQCRRGDAHRRGAGGSRAWPPAVRRFCSPKPITPPRSRPIGR